MDRIGRAADSADVLAQEFQRTLARELGCRGVVALALIAVEAVIGGIHEDLRFRVRSRELLYAGDGKHRIALAEMRHERAFGLLVAGVEYPVAIVREGTGESGRARGTHPDDEAAPAIADDADAAGGGRRVAGRGDIVQSRTGARPRLELATARDVLRRIADIELALVTVEQRRRDRDVAIRCKSVADGADVAI